MKSLTGWSRRIVSLVAVAAALFVSCSKDEDSGRLKLDSPVLFVDELGQTATVGFTWEKLKSVTVTNVPEGWEASADMAKGVITVKAPKTLDGDNKESGSVVLTGNPAEGSLVSASLFVGIVKTADLSDKRANSYLVSQKNTYYTFDALHKGETSEQLATASINVIWQTAAGLLEYVDFKDGKAKFYVGSDSDDDTKIKQGNALIGAYDASGNLIWSWHIWAADYDPDADALTYSNGQTVMSRNLGALDNANASDKEILASFGLFYQWGRKEPFVGPSSYNASQGTGAAMYDSANKRVYVTFPASDAETGTQQYATANPLKFITGVKDSQYDWLYSAHAENLWADVKTVNDPCPKGWRVASANTFAGLSIADKSGTADDYFNKYGWVLTDGSVSSLYMAAGRRVYTDGKFQNVYNPLPEVRNEALEAQPWVGLYWTTGTDIKAQSSAFYFYFDKRDVAASGVEAAVPHYRANGMQVRCVKVK